MKFHVGVIAMALLAGCEPSPSPPPPEGDSSRALERAVQEPLDKARAVEDRIKVEKARQDREIEEGGGAA
jgi:hypothetical protein